MSHNSYSETKSKVEQVISILRDINPSLDDRYAGAAGRVISAWTGWNPVEIHGVFANNSRLEHYCLKLSLGVEGGRATPEDIAAASKRIAEIAARVPKFTGSELQNIYAALDEILGENYPTY